MKLSCLTNWNILVVFPHSFPVSSRSGGTELGSLLVLSTFAAWAAQKPVLKFCVRMFLEIFIFSGSSANLLLQMLGNAGKWWKQAASSLTKDFYCCWLCRRDFKVNFKIVLPRKSWFRRMALAIMHREEVCSQLFLQTACIWCLSWTVVCRKLFCPEWESQQCQGPITPSLSKVSVLFTVWTGWLKIPVLVCASKRFWWQGPLNAMQTPTSLLLGAPRRLLGEEDTPRSRQGATRSEGGWLPIPVPTLVFLAPAAMLEAPDTSVPPSQRLCLSCSSQPVLWAETESARGAHQCRPLVLLLPTSCELGKQFETEA